MLWPKTGATYYHAKLGLSDKRSCNQRVGCLLIVTLHNTLSDCACNTAIRAQSMFKLAWRLLIPEEAIPSPEYSFIFA